RGPFLYSWVLFIHGRGCCLPPFVSRAERPRRVLCVGHPHCVWAWWALAAMALTPTGAVADASTTAPVLRDRAISDRRARRTAPSSSASRPACPPQPVRPARNPH